jgi:hypothetical protein
VQVIQGSIVIYGEVPRTVVRQGETFQFDWTKPHEIVALEDKTVIFNKLLNGVPAEARDIPFDQRQGSMEDTLHNPIKYY